MLVPPEELHMNGNLEETWPVFKQRFLLYLKATGAATWPGGQKVALFLTVAGPQALQVYNSFQLDPKDEDNFEVVLACFEGHCMPRRNETYERFLFRIRFQEPHESLEDFAAELQRKSHFCKFGAQRESLVRDQIVLGCTDDKLRQRLLQQDDLTLEGALQICHLAELKAKEVQHSKDCRRLQELETAKKQFELQNGKEAARRKVRRVQTMSNAVDYWQQKGDLYPRKATSRTYI